MNLNQITDMTHDMQLQSKDVIENAMSESLNKLRFLFESEYFASVDKALNEVA
ncbi:unnamed protein product, partial [Hymenolepis diminuta]